MRWADSLQARLALWLGVVLTTLWLAATTWTITDLRHEVSEVFDSGLMETTQRLLPLTVTEIINRDPSDGVQHLAPISEHAEFFTYIVRDDTGKILLQSHSADPALFPDWQGPGFAQNATHRFYSEATLRGTIRMTVAEPLEERDETIAEMTGRLVLPVLLFLPLTLLAVVVLVRLGLSGLTRFRAGLADRGAHDLSPVPVADLPAELRPVAETINDVLNRLSNAFEAERAFAANAAHELRTPLAGAIAQAQRLRSETRDAATASRAEAIEATLKRLTRTAERLMQLARAEGGRLRTDTPADLRPVLRIITDEIAGARDRLSLCLPDTPVMSDLDVDAVAIIARNLIDNALRHGAKDAQVDIALSPDGQLSVANDGPVVPADTLAGLTDRFARHGTAEGSGLGLAIVAAIARRVDAPLQLRSPRPGSDSGVAATIRLPLVET
ncbi:sensor histidine kinase [Yoonia sp.]|uniref:sensor histidine kinase n=1 Tax=Yoonia sp. TaxID=2212373 RepID=UPI003F6B92FF